MASFSYKFTNNNDVNSPLFLTWETGYKNLKVYYKGEIIQQIPTPQELLKGVIFDTDELKDVSIKLAKEKPMVVRVKVGRKEYFPENKINNREELKGLIRMFWFLFALSFVVAFFEIITYFNIADVLQIVIIVVLDVVVVASYAFTAIMLSKEYAWSYFIGGSVYILLTLLVVLNSFQGAVGMGVIIGFLIRGAIIIYILKFIPIILRMMKNGKPSNQNDLLDDFNS